MRGRALSGSRSNSDTCRKYSASPPGSTRGDPVRRPPKTVVGAFEYSGRAVKPGDTIRILDSLHADSHDPPPASRRP